MPTNWDTKLVDKGYMLPNPPAPYDSLCVKVYIPNHLLYIGAFWSAYQFFTSWLAWTRDPLHKGRQAAALWKTAYNKSRAEFELRKGVCEMNVTGIRQNPNNKCELQVEFDGNNQWITVADMKDCNGCGGGGAMQFDGVNVSIFNDCTNEFEPSGEPFNPITKGIYDSLYNPDEQGRCNGAANIAAWVKYVSDESLSILSVAGNAGAATGFVVGTLISMAGGAFLTEALIGGMIVELSDNAELLDDAAALDISDEVKLILYPYMEDDGTIREPNFTEAVTALYARRDEETIDTAERVRWGHEANIISAVGPYVVSKQNKYAGIDDADCSGANWVEIFDFTVSKYGWLKDPLTTLFPSELTGIWQSGVGWKAQTAEHSMGGFWTQARIAVNIPPRTITGVKIYYNTNLGTDEVAPEFAADLTVGWLKTTGTGQEVVDTELVANGTNVYEFTGSEASVTAITASLIIWHDADPSDDPTIAGKITKIVLEGTGTNPFE